MRELNKYKKEKKRIIIMPYNAMQKTRCKATYS